MRDLVRAQRLRRTRARLVADAARALNNYFRALEMPFVAATDRRYTLIVVTGGGRLVLRSSVYPQESEVATLVVGRIEHTELGLIRAFNRLFYGSLDLLAEYQEAQKQEERNAA